MEKKTVYKIIFANQGQLCEIYAKKISQSNLLGFIEVETLLFGESGTVVVDPSEERLKSEFAGVDCSFIPVHSIIRIDRVEKTGVAKIKALKGSNENITQFPKSSTFFSDFPPTK